METPTITSVELLTSPGAVLGTVAYMSPEQARGEELDARTDLFSFGAVLYQMVTARLAFSGQTSAIIHDAILNRSPALPSTVISDVSPESERIINKALEKDRDLRLSGSAAEMRTDLQRIKRDTESGKTSATAGSLSRTSKPPAAQRTSWLLIAASVLVLAACAVGGYFYLHRPPKLTDKDTIVLADFAKSTGDPIFDDTMKQALSASLRQSPFLNVLSDSRVSATLKQMTRPPNTPLTPEIIREVCQRADSKAHQFSPVPSPRSALNIASRPQGHQLPQWRHPRAGTGHRRKQRKSSRRRRQGCHATCEVCSELHDFVGSLDVPLSQVTTVSLDALKAFSLGNQTLREKGLLPPPYISAARR